MSTDVLNKDILFTIRMVRANSDAIRQVRADLAGVSSDQRAIAASTDLATAANTRQAAAIKTSIANMKDAGAAGKTAVSDMTKAMSAFTDGNVPGMMKALSGGLKDVGSASEDAGKKIATAHGSISTMTREFRALFDEIGSGRYRQAIGSLTILLTSGFGVGPAMLATSAAILAIPAAIAVAMVRFDQAQTAIGQALKATGNQSGLTADQVAAMGDAFAKSAHESQASGEELVAGIARYGLTGKAIQAVTDNVADFAAMTGQDTVKAAEQLAQAMQKPYDGAKKLDDQFNFLTAAQLDNIKAMVEQGDVTGAVVLAMQALHDRSQGAADGVDIITKAWRGLKDEIIGVAEASAKSLGADMGVGTLQDQITKTQSDITVAQATSPMAAAMADGAMLSSNDLPRLQKKLAMLQAQQAIGQSQANDDAAAARQRLDAKAADDALKAAQPIMTQRDTLGNNLSRYKAMLEADPNNADLQNLVGRLSDQYATTYTSTQANARDIQDARTIAGTPRANRARISAGIAAVRGADGTTISPAELASKQGAAQTISDINLTTQSQDQIDKLNEQAAASGRLTDAVGQGNDVYLKQQAIEEALAATKDGLTNKTKQYTQALLDQRAAAAVLQGAQTLASGGTTNAGLRGEAAAVGLGRSEFAQAQIAAQTSQTYQPLMDAASAAGDQQKLQTIREQAAAYADILNSNRELNAIITSGEQVQDMKDELQYKQTELSLLGQTVEVRDKELAQLKLRQTLVKSGLSGDDLTKAIADQTELASKIGLTDAAITNATKAQKDWHDTVKQFGDAFTSALSDAIMGTKSLTDAVYSLVQAMEKAAINSLITQPLDKLFNQLGNAGGGGFSGLLSSLFGGGAAASVDSANLASAGGYLANLFHDGGVVGYASRLQRSVDPAVFSGARRYHSGGLLNGEVPIIAQEGEGVFPMVRLPNGQTGVQAVGTGGQTVFAPSVVVNVNGAPPQGTTSHDQGKTIADQINKALDNKMAEFVMKQSRSGGQMNRTATV